MFRKVWSWLDGWKTRLLNLISILVLGLLTILPHVINILMATDMSPLLPPEYVAVWGIGLGVVNLALREVTTKPAPPWRPWKNRRPLRGTHRYGDPNLYGDPYDRV